VGALRNANGHERSTPLVRHHKTFYVWMVGKG
jgi:hypothetical protein